MKDTRKSKYSHAKRVTKRQRRRRLMIISVVALLVLLVVIVCIVRGCSAGTGESPVPTTTVNHSTTAASATATAPVTTATVTQETTAATEPTAAPADVSGHYVQPSGAAWNLRLANAWNTMTQAQSDELPITYFSNGEYCDSRIVDSLSAMLSDGADYGLYVTSGYRSYSLQEELFENKIGRVQNEYGCSYEEAEVIAATEVARPGTSEHNTGLAVDLLNNQCSDLEEYWEDTDAFDWLMAHCADYGFILRFPKDGQDSTGVIYEPWHYRYVGTDAAREIMSRGITLEQYLQERGQ